LQIYNQDLFCLAMARKLKRPVRWVEERSVNAVATVHGRGQVQDIELAADSDGKITAVRVHLIGDMGAHCRLFSPAIPVIGAAFYHGCYDVWKYSVTITSVYTNLPPTDAYRGAGRPEATYAIERAVDGLAAEMGMDPAEIRRRNFIPPFDNGHQTVAMVELDSGDYQPANDTALVPFGNITGGSRSLAVEGSCLSMTCDKVLEKAKVLAAHLLEAAEGDLEFVGGAFNVKGTPAARVALTELAYVSSFEAQ